MKRHLKNCGEHVKMLQCDKCNFKTSAKLVFGEHLNKVHGRILNCDYCDFKSENRHHMKIHMKRCKISTIELLCQHCNKRFSSRAGLDLHIYHQHKRNKHVQEATYNFESNETKSVN